MDGMMPSLPLAVSSSSSPAVSTSSNGNSNSSVPSPVPRPELFRAGFSRSRSYYARREAALRRRAGTIATIEDRQLLRDQVRNTALRWVDGGAVYIDRATGRYWEITGPLLAILRARRHTQTSHLTEERLAAFEAQLHDMSSVEVGAAAKEATLETEMVMLEGLRRGDADWRPEGFVDRAPSAMAEIQRRGFLCGPLEDKDILTGLDSWFESQTPALSPVGGYGAFSPSAGL